MSIELRIFRQPTKAIQSDGKFYYDTLQFRDFKIHKHITTHGISGMESETVVSTAWEDVPIFDADRYEVLPDEPE